MVFAIILIVAVLAFVIGWFALPKGKANAEFQDDTKTIYICKRCGTPTICKDGGCSVCSGNDYMETGLKPSYVKAQRACGRWSEVLKQYFYESQVTQMTQLEHQLQLEKQETAKSPTTDTIAKDNTNNNTINIVSGIVAVVLIFVVIFGISQCGKEENHNDNKCDICGDKAYTKLKGDGCEYCYEHYLDAIEYYMGE